MLGMADLVEIFSRNLRAFRNSKAMSQAALAQLSGLSIESIKGYESGRRWPQLIAIQALAAALKVRESSLFFDPDNVDQPPLDLVTALKRVAEEHGFDLRRKK